MRPDLNALTPATHHPVDPQDRFDADLAFCGNRMPDRETRVAEFFFKPAALLPNRHFLLGGNGWDANVVNLPNLRYLGHVYTADHNAFNATPLAVLNVCRESMARHMGDLAQRRVLTEHTCAQRAHQVQQCLLASPRSLRRAPCHG